MCGERELKGENCVCEGGSCFVLVYFFVCFSTQIEIEMNFTCKVPLYNLYNMSLVVKGKVNSLLILHNQMAAHTGYRINCLTGSKQTDWKALDKVIQK